MKEEPNYSLSALVTLATWIATAATLVAAWLVWLLGGDMMVAILVAETACTLSAVAAVLQIRCFVNRNLRIVRVMYGLERPGSSAEADPENLRRI